MKESDLHRYARMNQVEELLQMIMKGIKLNEKDGFGATALHCAIAEKSVDVIALLLEHNADVTAQDSDGKTPMHYAIEYNLPAVAEELLKKNSSVIAIADRFGNEPLWTAAFNAKGNYELVSLLLRYGADPEHRNNINLSPLDIPKRKRDDGLLRILESKKATGSRGQT
jgi:ankyrin repeat protein